jgi:hypothetical protein
MDDNDNGWGFYVVIDMPSHYSSKSSYNAGISHRRNEFRSRPRPKIINTLPVLEELSVIEEVPDIEMCKYEENETKKEKEKEKEKENELVSNLLQSFCVILLVGSLHLLIW